MAHRVRSLSKRILDSTTNRNSQFHATLFDKLLLLDQLRGLYWKVRTSSRPILDSLLSELRISYQIAPEDLVRIPRRGATVVVANHPFGLLEGVILGSVLPRIRTDFKMLTNYLLAGLPELDPLCIFVDPFQGKDAIGVNQRGLRQALHWLSRGGMLVIFPAGEVSHWNLRSGRTADPEWSEIVSRVIRRTAAAALPMYFEGSNSIPFHLLGGVHPRFRTAALPSELLNKSGRTVTLRIGRPIPARMLETFPTDADATRYLRWRTYLLASRSAPVRRPIPFPRLMLRSTTKHVDDIVVEQPADLVESEIENLAPDRKLEENAELQVFLAEAAEIPVVLKEIGRLREITFREVGEGTGRPIDLDAFDQHYMHLFVWNRLERKVVGAYRLGCTQDILPRLGIQGLYTRTLFRYDERLLSRLGPAVELGRSFVRAEYQKQFAPLLLVWKGISRQVARRPEAPVLFGPVSISNNYRPASRQLIAQYLAAKNDRQDLTALIRPRKALHLARMYDWDFAACRGLLHDLDELSDPVADIEPDGKGVPILLKQYVRLGGQVVAFNIDTEFSNALDGFLVLDLRQTDRAVLSRYMGRDGAVAFLQFHAKPHETPRLRHTFKFS